MPESHALSANSERETRFVTSATSDVPRYARVYHRPTCREVTKGGAVTREWVPYDPLRIPPSEQRRPCKVCIKPKSSGRKDEARA